MPIINRVGAARLICAVFTAVTVSLGAGPIATAPTHDTETRAVAAIQPGVGTATPPMPEPPDHAARAADKVCVGTAPRSACRRYAGLYRAFPRAGRPSGIGATFSVHKPGQMGRGEHSLAEIAIRRTGSSGDIIEVGWRRRLGKTTLFVYRWNNNHPACYNRCGFVARGPGKKPGSKLRPGTSVRTEWRHHHRRWNLYVNGEWAGFYPDRLWDGTFRQVGAIQVFGEVSFRRNGTGRCIDMGNGRFPRYVSARVFGLRFVDSSVAYRGGVAQITAPRLYGYDRTSPTSFKYGGPGPC